MKRKEFDTKIWDKIKAAHTLLYEAVMEACVVDCDMASHIDQALTAVRNAEARCEDLTKIECES
jgi:hypothetical protein